MGDLTLHFPDSVAESVDPSTLRFRFHHLSRRESINPSRQPPNYTNELSVAKIGCGTVQYYPEKQ
jgi:hypothetical protein